MTTTPSDYERIERAIRYLVQHRLEQPSLAEVAAEVGLSESHLQRVFRRWAGVSPKRFLQYLTAAHAKRLLRAGTSVLETTLATGLSAPSRLHDLFVSLEAMTPGEYKRLGADLTIRFGVHDSPFGPALVAATPRGVCWLSFVEPGETELHVRELADRWPLSRLAEDPAATAPLAERIFESQRADAPLNVLVRGTNFEIRVWDALLNIPPGTAATYGAVARTLGAPGASRAVGGAVARNAVGYVIPCHRVIRSTGAFGDYRWGAARKRAMLAYESAATTDATETAAR